MPLALVAAGLLSCGRVIEVPGPPATTTGTAPRPTSPAASGAPPAVPTVPSAMVPFVKTQDSDAWVDGTLKIQKRYGRILAVGKPAPASVKVAPLDLNGHAGAAEPEERAVDSAFETLQDAANAARGGDLVAVLPGTYVGFVIGDKPDAGDESYIHFKAMGSPGEVIVNQGAVEDPNWMIDLKAAHHVIIEGFNLAGSSQPGQASASGPRAGILVDGDFVETGKLAHHIVIVGNFSHNHRSWGFHSVDSRSVLLQENLFAFSAREHGAYASDGSDDYVVRRNVFFGNNASGFQANLDPEASLDKVASHPAMRDYPKKQPSRSWAEGLLQRAAAKFGEHGFPDGRGYNFIIEDNVANGNGRGGGAAINLAALSDSVIQNNLIYGNQASGIAQWDNANPFDQAYVEPGPTSPEQVGGPDALPLFGCRNNLIRNNTVIQDNGRRAALQCGNGSFGCRVRNNILINDAGASLEVMGTSIYKLDAGYNLVSQVSYSGMPAALKSLAVSLPETRTTAGMTRARLAAELLRMGDEPWVVIEGTWWALNPKRPDFRPKPWSRLLIGQGDARELPAHDLLGEKRGSADLGAFAAASR